MEIVYVLVCILILIVISKYSKNQESKKKVSETQKRWKDEGLFK